MDEQKDKGTVERDPAKDAANKLVVRAGATVGACAGGAAAGAAATAVAASTVPVTGTVFAGVLWTSGGFSTASPALILLAAHPVCAAAIGAAAFGVGAYKLGRWLLR
jgi:hypothetical protein